VFDEIYEKALLNSEIAERIIEKGFKKEMIVADSSEPKSIVEIRKAGVMRIKAADKGPDSIRAGIQFIQQFKIIVHPSCTNFINELSNYTWAKSKDGQAINKPIDEFNHLLDSFRYSLETIRKRTRKLGR